VSVLENAFVLAASGRLMRPADAPPCGTLRLAGVFFPVIEEVLGLRISPDYYQYFHHKLERVAPAR